MVFDILSNIWETLWYRSYEWKHSKNLFKYLRDNWEGLWYRSFEWIFSIFPRIFEKHLMRRSLISYHLSTTLIWVNEWVQFLKVSINQEHPQEQQQKKNSKKKQNTRTCDKNSPVFQIEEKSHCFEAGVLYSSQRCGDVIGAVSWWRHIVVPVWVAVKY